MALHVVTVGHLDLTYKSRCSKVATTDRCEKCGNECYGGNQLKRYWVEKLEQGKHVNGNKELVAEVVKDLIWEFEQKVEGYVASKQFPTCTDTIQMLSLAPWDFLCRLRVGRAFENQIKRLDEGDADFPGGLLTRIVKLCHLDCGPDLIDFVIYRPDVLYHRLKKGLDVGPELDKIKKIKRTLKADYEKALGEARPDLSLNSLGRAAMLNCTNKYITRQEAYAKDKSSVRGRRSSLNHVALNTTTSTSRPFAPTRQAPNPGRRRTSLQLNSDLLKVKKKQVQPKGQKVKAADVDGTDEKGITVNQSKISKNDPPKLADTLITVLMHLCFHRSLTKDMAYSLLVAGADPNKVSKRGNDVFDALFAKRSYVPESWDGFDTARLFLDGAQFWSAHDRAEVNLYRVRPERKQRLIDLIKANVFLTLDQKDHLIDRISADAKNV